MLAQLTWTVVGLLVATALLDDVVSDYLWGRAVVLTSATVATLGLSITIPLALLTDTVLHPDTNMPTAPSIVGAVLVVAGFVCVNIFHDRDASTTATAAAAAAVVGAAATP